MTRPQMHDGQVSTDEPLLRRLLSSQFPEWAQLPIVEVDTHGTDHDLYRLGESLVARLPIIGWASAQAEKEATWLPRLAPDLPVAVPSPVAIGDPDEGYPFPWSIHRWLPGSDATTADFDLDQAALDLARFVLALRSISTAGAHARPTGARGGALEALDASVRRSINQLGDRIDRTAVLGVWTEALAAKPWRGDDVWIHSDLLPGNLLFVDARLSAVIDWGGLNVGDPACDLLPLWNAFTGSSRDIYRHELRVGEDEWLRGRGWTIQQAVAALPYYWDTNPGMVRQAMHALSEVLAE